jgi:DNA-binding NarL/FixJ family response regulator
METVRILIADDHPLYRNGLRMTLSSLGNFDVVAEASNGQEAVERAGQHRPDVAVMDVNMPVLNGIDATRLIVEANPDVGVLMLTMFEDDDSVFAAMRAGARGYVLKEADEQEIERAIHAVAKGEAIFGASIATRILKFFASGRAAAPAVPFPELTDRERDVLQLIASGMNNSAIANKLFLSQKTVRNHVSNIFMKMQVADRAEAIVRARRAGLGDPGAAGRS